MKIRFIDIDTRTPFGRVEYNCDCGRKLTDDTDRFCGNCGTELDWSSVVRNISTSKVVDLVSKHLTEVKV